MMVQDWSAQPRERKRCAMAKLGQRRRRTFGLACFGVAACLGLLALRSGGGLLRSEASGRADEGSFVRPPNPAGLPPQPPSAPGRPTQASLTALPPQQQQEPQLGQEQRQQDHQPLINVAVPVLMLAFCALASRPAFAATATAAATPDLSGVLSKAAGSAFRGGISGLLAGVAQVLSFMWLRTSMNYQYFNGGDLRSALSTLWQEGGIARLYQGVSLAIIQAPLSRFGDTAANAGVLVILDVYFPDLPMAAKTAGASTAAALWRVFLTPVDTLKTVRQVQGERATDVLMERVKQGGIGELYAGAVANFAANWVGNFPYFSVFNTLSESWAVPEDPMQRIVRNGLIGMCASIASDIISNSLRVLKTLRQSSTDSDEGYLEAARRVIDQDGWWGLLGRGLETRLLTNVLQGSFFAIVWKLIEESLGGR